MSRYSAAIHDACAAAGLLLNANLRSFAFPHTPSRYLLSSMLLNLLYLTAAVLLTPYFIYRRVVKRKRSGGWRARMGYAPERPAGVTRVWIHAVSVGEAAAAETLVKALRQALPDLDVVVSTTTTTGQEVAAKRYGADKVFYYPHDFSWVVKRTLDRVKPSMLVLMELEVWPTMTAEAVRRGIPVVVVNARVSERAAWRYKRFWCVVGPSFRRVKRWLAQSDEYATRLRDLGVDPAAVEVSGNLKYDAIDVALPSDAERQQLRARLGLPGDAPVLVGGSTHPTEETALRAAYTQLRNGPHPNLRLILVPRHPERSGDVEREVTAAGFSCLRLSTLRANAAKSQEPTANSQQPRANGPQASSPKPQALSVLLVDTVGELRGMYKAADVAFVGGSLIPHGGQNVMEPCGLGVPVLHGPHMHNFNEAMEILRACKGSVEVTRESLTAELERLFASAAEAKQMAGRARAAFLSKQGATARAVAFVSQELRNAR
ncbi:MAG: 3-deoxy-D-manno-octulosonic acid transferase [Planctomycetota bacterium]|nr:3-deoxy-D-manno-octulosonic acid transferase [Planctomycetota bacterium]